MAFRNFSIQIFDRDDPDAVTILESAKRYDISLKYKGSDEKTANIVGSELAFNIKSQTNEDAELFELYTNDERKYKVVLYDEDEASILWLGHIIPDQYSEPFKNGALFVGFAATCGLGTLKGLFLPDDFYTEEKSVIEIIAECLKLTGLDINFYFSPAIINQTQNDYNQLYLDTSIFVSSQNKNNSAYKILETILKNFCLTVYQERGEWYVLGYNIRAISLYTMQKFTYEGVYIEDVDVEREAIDVVAYDEPIISVQPPIKRATVTVSNDEIVLPTCLSKDDSDGYTTLNNIEGFDARCWRAYNGYYANVVTSDNYVRLIPHIDTLDVSKNIGFERKPYVYAGQKLKIAFDLYLNPPSVGWSSSSDASISNNGHWDNFVFYGVFVNDTVIISSGTGLEYRLNFDANRSASQEKEFIVPENGYLDFRFYRPVVDYVDYDIDSISIKSITLQEISPSTTETFELLNDEVFTIVEDIDLDFTDAIGNHSNLIRLEKLNDVGVTTYAYDFNPVAAFTSNSVSYVQAPLRAIINVKDHQEFVQVQQNGVGSFEDVPVIEVIYNYFNGEQFVFSYDAVALGFTITTADIVRANVKDINHPEGDRALWQNWTDSVYPINFKRFGEVVSEIFFNLYKDTHFVLEGDFSDFLLPSQLINFKFNGDRIWVPLGDITWNLTEGRSRMRFIESFYGVSIVENIPPLVYAGEDFTILDGETTTNLLATESDPDGFIVSRLWEVITGIATIESPGLLTTPISGMVGNFWTFKITVTDNGGLTASDTVSVNKVLDYELDYENIDTEQSVDQESQTLITEDKLIIAPALLNDSILRLKHSLEIDVENNDNGGNSQAQYRIEKNGIEVYEQTFFDTTSEEFLFEVLYLPGDNIRYFLDLESNSASGEGNTSASITSSIYEVVFEQGNGQITNLPQLLTGNTSAQG